MKKINKLTLIKYKKQIQELFKLGKQYDKETDPEKKELLKAEVIKRCNELKPKLNLKDKEAQEFLGVPADLDIAEGDEEKTSADEDSDAISQN